MDNTATLENIINLCARRGFFYQTSDIYGGLNGIYDKGHLGVLLQRNIEKIWRYHMYGTPYQMIEMDGAIIGNSAMWKASGHIDGFSDPLIDCKQCKARFRTDDIDCNRACMRCGKKDWSESRQFNMMLSTNTGPMEDSSTKAYLRPETAQSIFVQFKNIISTYRLKIPFGILQIGKAFRNEITPRQFLFRMREFSQMEMEFFCQKRFAHKLFLYWKERRKEFYEQLLGFTDKEIRLSDHAQEDLSHYSDATTDIEFHFPFGWKELEGIAYRTDYDLSQHKKHSGKDLSLYDTTEEESYIPHVIECSVGVERLMLATLCSAYCQETLSTGIRTFLKLPAYLAPITCAIFPMSDNEYDYAFGLYKQLSSLFSCNFDSSGSIGKRYRRFDEIGTPWCITIDTQSLEDGTMTLRHRDTMEQQRIMSSEIIAIIAKSLLLKK